MALRYLYDARYVIASAILAIILISIADLPGYSALKAPPQPLAELALDRPSAASMVYPDWLAFSPNGKYLAARYDAAETDSLSVWTVADWKCAAQWQPLSHPLPRRGAAGTCAFNRESDSIVSLDGDVVIRKYSVSDKTVADILKPKHSLRSFLPEALAMSEGKEGAVAFTLFGSSDIKPVFHAIECANGLNGAKVSEVAISHQFETVSRLASGPACLLLSGRLKSDTTQFAVWKYEIKDGKISDKKIYQSDVGITSIAAGWGNQHIAIGTAAGEVLVVNESGESVYSKRPFRFSVTSCQFSDDGACILAGSADRAPQSNLILLNWKNDKLCLSVNAGPKGVLRSCIAPHAKYIAAIGSDDIIRIWDTAAKEK